MPDVNWPTSESRTTEPADGELIGVVTGATEIQSTGWGRLKGYIRAGLATVASVQTVAQNLANHIANHPSVSFTQQIGPSLTGDIQQSANPLRVTFPYTVNDRNNIQNLLTTTARFSAIVLDSRDPTNVTTPVQDVNPYKAGDVWIRSTGGAGQSVLEFWRRGSDDGDPYDWTKEEEHDSSDIDDNEVRAIATSIVNMLVPTSARLTADQRHDIEQIAHLLLQTADLQVNDVKGWVDSPADDTTAFAFAANQQTNPATLSYARSYDYSAVNDQNTTGFIRIDDDHEIGNYRLRFTEGSDHYDFPASTFQHTHTSADWDYWSRFTRATTGTGTVTLQRFDVVGHSTSYRGATEADKATVSVGDFDNIPMTATNVQAVLDWLDDNLGSGGMGSTLYFGTTAPADSLGANGDRYLRFESAELSAWTKASGTWTEQNSITVSGGGSGITQAQLDAAIATHTGMSSAHHAKTPELRLPTQTDIEDDEAGPFGWNGQSMWFWMNDNIPDATQAQAQGNLNVRRIWSPLRIRQAIDFRVPQNRIVPSPTGATDGQVAKISGGAWTIGDDETGTGGGITQAQLDAAISTHTGVTDAHHTRPDSSELLPDPSGEPDGRVLLTRSSEPSGYAFGSRTATGLDEQALTVYRRINGTTVHIQRIGRITNSAGESLLVVATLDSDGDFKVTADNPVNVHTQLNNIAENAYFARKTYVDGRFNGLSFDPLRVGTLPAVADAQFDRLYRSGNTAEIQYKRDFPDDTFLMVTTRLNDAVGWVADDFSIYNRFGGSVVGLDSSFGIRGIVDQSLSTGWRIRLGVTIPDADWTAANEITLGYRDQAAGGVEQNVTLTYNAALSGTDYRTYESADNTTNRLFNYRGYDIRITRDGSVLELGEDDQYEVIPGEHELNVKIAEAADHDPDWYGSQADYDALPASKTSDGRKYWIEA